MGEPPYQAPCSLLREPESKSLGLVVLGEFIEEAKILWISLLTSLSSAVHPWQ